MLALIACCYLLFRRSNAIAPDVTPPTRLRRWTAAFFATIAMCHIWYLPTYFLTSPDEVMLGYLIAGWLDCMTVIPLMIIILLTMLQDRRRPLWPVCVIMAPLVVGLAWYIVSRSDDLLLVLFVYFLLMWLGVIIYMVGAIRQYGRWLRDNYADLEHKEVWQGFVVLAIYLLVYAIYSLDVGEQIYEYAMEVIIIILVCYLLWRVETLSDLSIDLGRFACKEYWAIVETALRGTAALFAIQHLPPPACSDDWNQPSLSEPAFLQSGHDLQCLHQRTAHPALYKTLP